MGSFSLWHWLVVLVIVVLVFGTKKLGSMGKDVGSAVKGFKDGMRDGTADGPAQQVTQTGARVNDPNTVDVEARPKV